MDAEEKTLLDCPVCLEVYDEGARTPKMMPCLHSVCAYCIHELCSSSTTLARPCTPTTRQASPPPPPRPSSLAARGRTTPDPAPDDQDDHVYQEPDNHQEAGSPAKRPGIVRGANLPAITAIANLLQGSRGHPPLRRLSDQTAYTSIPPRHPRDPLPSTPPPLPPSPEPSPPALPPRNTGTGGAPAPARPQKKAALTLKTKPCHTTSKEPEIPRNWTIICPLCRSQCSTSKLQTNRYVLAHLRDLARLQPPPESVTHQPIVDVGRTTPPSSPPSAPALTEEDFWCMNCEAPAQDCCASHELLPLHQWLETQRNMLEELRTSIQSRLNDYCNDLDDTDADVKIILQSLNKASRHLTKARKEAQEVRQQLGYQTPPSAHPYLRVQAQDFAHRIACLRDLEGRVSSLSAGTDSDEVYLYRQNNKLYVSTCQPDRTIIITIGHGQRQT